MSAAATILIIDDDHLLRHSLSLILQRGGYRITSAATAQEGLSALENGPFDLGFLDLRLPDRDGLAILPDIRRMHPDMPVVILTAHATLDSAMQAIRQGATDYMLKPIQPESIVGRVGEILSEQRGSQRRKEILAEMKGLLDELHQMNGGVEGSSASGGESLVDSSRYLRKGAVVVDLHGRRVSVEDRQASVSPSSFDYLVTLMRHSPDPVSFVTLVSEAQGFSTTTQEARELARVHVHELRKAIELDMSRPRYIITARNIGYQFVA